jgi:hypothetical protein
MKSKKRAIARFFNDDLAAKDDSSLFPKSFVLYQGGN